MLAAIAIGAITIWAAAGYEYARYNNDLRLTIQWGIIVADALILLGTATEARATYVTLCCYTNRSGHPARR